MFFELLIDVENMNYINKYGKIICYCVFLKRRVILFCNIDGF